MSIISSASSSSSWRGLDYYKKNKIKNLKKLNDFEYASEVIGSETYSVYLNISHPRRSTCNCPFANGKKIICKHIVATFPQEAINFEKEQERLQEEYENYQAKLYNKTQRYIKSLTKKELIEELSYVLDYAPDWVYNDFVRKNDIE